MRRQQATIWLQDMVGTLSISAQPSEEELKMCLRNGLILCKVINKVQNGAIQKVQILTITDTQYHVCCYKYGCISLITLTVGVRGAFLKSTISHLETLHIPMSSIHRPMESLQIITIKYLALLVLNK